MVRYIILNLMLALGCPSYIRSTYFTILKADGLDSNDAYGMSPFTMCLSARTQDKTVAMQADISHAA